MKKLSFNMIAMALLAFMSLSCKEDDHIQEIINNDPVVPQMFSINARGTATGKLVEDYELPGFDLTVSGNAFSMSMYDPISDEVIGTLIDINVAAETFDDGSMFGENYTIFQFNDTQQSTLVLHNLIDMIPASPTHLNAFIKRENIDDNVVGGTGRYAAFSGGATLVATLDMSKFSENQVGFNCMYGFTRKGL